MSWSVDDEDDSDSWDGSEARSVSNQIFDRCHDSFKVRTVTVIQHVMHALQDARPFRV